jgi:hypothetical protein
VDFSEAPVLVFYVEERQAVIRMLLHNTVSGTTSTGSVRSTHVTAAVVLP